MRLVTLVIVSPSASKVPSSAVPVPVVVPTSMLLCKLTISKLNSHKALTKPWNPESSRMTLASKGRRIVARTISGSGRPEVDVLLVSLAVAAVVVAWLLLTTGQPLSYCSAPPRMLGVPEVAPVLGPEAAEPGGEVPCVIRT